MSWKQQQRAKGWKDVMVWLSPEAVQALDHMVKETGKKKQAILNEALLAYSGEEARDTSGHGLMDRIEALEARVERLEKPQDKAIEAVTSKRGEGKSYRTIAEELNQEGAPLPPESKSEEWTKSIVEKYFKKMSDHGGAQ